MIGKWIKKWQSRNEAMNKLLKQLEVPTDWLYNGKTTYTHNESEIKIKWGTQYHRESSQKWRHVTKPVMIRIPFRYRKSIGKQIEIICDRHRKPEDDLSFFNDYLDGLYKIKTTIPSEQKSEITAWMLTNGINEWHIIGDTIWFKNEEDAVAAKLRWI